MAEHISEERSRHERDHDLPDQHRHEHSESANDIVKDYALWTAGFGLIPLPLLDIAAITGTQVRMVSKLNKHYRKWHPERYDSSFSHERIRAIIASLIGGSVPVVAGAGIGSLLKSIPVVGQALGMVTTPTFAWASTVAVGRVFIEHFESGGTLLDFDADKMRHYYYRQFEAAKHGSKVRDGKEDASGYVPPPPSRTGKGAATA